MVPLGPVVAGPTLLDQVLLPAVLPATATGIHCLVGGLNHLVTQPMSRRYAPMSLAWGGK
jgi:hypothetical protein